jgi:RecB family exonuclease
MSKATLKVRQMTIAKRFKNKYVSVSRLKRYENCQLSFKFRYIDKLEIEPGTGGDFGKLEHAALELIYKWVKRSEFSGIVPDAAIIKCYRQAYESEQFDHMTGEAEYRLGLELIRGYLADKEVNHENIIALEKEFLIKIKGVKIKGFIDRIDRVDDDTICIVDYKTNRMLFSREELDNDLQMTVYGNVVRKEYPDIKNVQYQFDMLRYGFPLITSRTAQELEDGAYYVKVLKKRIEKKKKFPAKLGVLCHWCDYKSICYAFQAALEDGASDFGMQVPMDLEKLAEEREKAATLKGIADRRQKELDYVLSAHIDNSEEGELIIGDRKYKLAQRITKGYPRDATLKLLSETLKIEISFLDKKLTAIGTRNLNKLIKDSKLPRTKEQWLNSRLNLIAKMSPGTPYVSSRKVAERKPRAKK